MLRQLQRIWLKKSVVRFALLPHKSWLTSQMPLVAWMTMLWSKPTLVWEKTRSGKGCSFTYVSGCLYRSKVVHQMGKRNQKQMVYYTCCYSHLRFAGNLTRAILMSMFVSLVNLRPSSYTFATPVMSLSLLYSHSCIYTTRTCPNYYPSMWLTNNKHGPLGYPSCILDQKLADLQQTGGFLDS